MDFDLNKNDEISETVKRYEALLKSGNGINMSDEELEEVVNYYYFGNKNQKALEAIENSLRHFPYDSYFYYIKSMIISEQGKMKEALKIIDMAINLEPSNPQYYCQKGEIYENFDKNFNAIEVYKEALKMGIESSEFYINIALNYNLEGHYDEAIKWMNKVDPTAEIDSTTLADIMFGFQIIDLQTECIEFFTKHVDNYPYSNVGWFLLAESYSFAENYKKALKAIDYSIVIEEDFFEAWNKKGFYLLKTDNYLEAIECFNKSIELYDIDPQVYCDLAKCYLYTKNYQAALKNYKHSIKLEKDNPEAWAGIGSAYFMLNENTKALHYLKKAVSLDESSEKNQILLAKIYTIIGKEEQAIKIYKTLAFENPSNPFLWIEWSYIYWCNDDKAEAILMLDSALETNENSAEILYRLAAYNLLAKEIKTGKLFLEKALGINFKKKELFFNFAPEFKKSSEINEIVELYNPENYYK